MIKVLYLHPFGAYGGATKSLTEMVSALPKGTVQGIAVTAQGVAAQSLQNAGLDTITVPGLTKWDNTRYGYYKGLRWLILLREFAYIPATIKALRRAARSGPYDLIHCNELPALLPGLLAKKLLKAPLLVHVRSLQRSDGSSFITRFINSLLRKHVDGIIAIDQAVRRTLPADLPVAIVHNGLKSPVVQPRPSRKRGEPFKVGIIGVLHRSKGVYEFLAAARLCRERGLDCQFFVVGDNIRPIKGIKGWMLEKFGFAADVRADLQRLAQTHHLQDTVVFTGFVSDIAGIYSQLDAVCFPSHLDAPGRPVLEAGLYGLPAIVAMREPTDDVIAHGKTGLCIEKPTPEAIAAAIEQLYSDPERSREMGNTARKIASERFDSTKVANATLAIYRRLAGL